MWDNPTIKEALLIVGRTEIPGFNGNGIISLKDLQSTPPIQIGGEFQYVQALDLSEVDEDDPMWLNDGIREEGNTEDRIEQFENAFEVKGFKTTYVPPIMGTDGKPRDGRGRIIAAKRRGESFIPTYVYAYDHDTEMQRISNGLKPNMDHDPSFSANRESIIKAGLHLIKIGELELAEVPVRHWLQHILKVQETFNARNITIIVNAILKRGVGGGEALVRIQDRKKWEKWVLKNLGFKVDNKQVFLLAADNDTYAYRAWCQHILPAIAENESPIKIVLYTNCHLPEAARKNVKKFATNLQFFRDASYTMVGEDYGLPMKPRTSPYELLGAVPQIIAEHNIDGWKLIDIDQY